MREIEGDIRSRVFAAMSLLLGSFSFFLVLGGVTALPYALLIAPDGNVAQRFAGMFSASTLVDAICHLTPP